jgi:hypothetical protein
MHPCLTQIQSLARITAGICLFNQAQGRGGAALPPGVASFVPQVRSPLPLVVWGDAPAQVQGGLGCSSALTWESTGVLLMPGHHTPVLMHEKTSRHRALSASLDCTDTIESVIVLLPLSDRSVTAA